MTTVERATRTVYQRPSPQKGIRARSGQRWAELLITAAAAGFFGWGLSKNGYGNEYYSAAARSMSRSWSAFLYASLDPHSWVTVDKPPMAMWTQALSARILGFHGWTLLVPSVICGALSVWVLMSTVQRAWGRTAGLAAGVLLALTPMVVAVSRSNNPDATLMLCAVLAAWATQRGIEDGEFRWLGWAGFFCGIGFLSKLLAAGLIMPGLWGAYLLCAPGRLRIRLGQCLGAAGVFFAVAVAWVLAVDLRSLSDRPWIGGSTDGTARDLVFGYNGFGRVTGAAAGPGGNSMGGAGGPGGPSGIGQMFGGAGGVNQFGGATGIGRLFNAGMGDQAMWFTPVAVVAALAGVVASIRNRRRDPRLGAVVMWTGWAVVVFVIYSFAEGIFHNYYISLLAPALAALAGIGVEQAHRVSRLGTVVVSATLLATAATHVVFIQRVDASTWLRVVVPSLVLAGVVTALVIAIALPAKGRVRTASFAVSGLALLMAPAIWSLAGVQHPQAGTFPDARPVNSSGAVAGGPGGIGGFPGGGSQITDAQWRWLESKRKDEKWILAMSSAMDAGAPLTEGRDVVALGGFSGSDGSASVARVAKAVARGDLRYFSASGFGGFGGDNGWRTAVSSACIAVDAAEWGGAGASSIYDCAGKATAIRKAAPPTTPGGAFRPGG